MGYLVVGADGKEYGPVDMATLAQWAKDDRVRPDSRLKDFETGRMITAAEVPGLFQPIVQPQQPSPYASPAPGQYPQQPQQFRPAYSDGGEANGAFLWAIIDSVLAVVGFYLLHTIGLIFGAFALINAFRAKSGGHRLGTLAIVIAVIAVGAVAAGWITRFQAKPATKSSAFDEPTVISLR